MHLETAEDQELWAEAEQQVVMSNKPDSNIHT